jgi:hypothetical protein
MTTPVPVLKNLQRHLSAPLLACATLVLCAACTPASRVRVAQPFKLNNAVQCIVVQNVETKLVKPPAFKKELDQRRFDAMLRVARVYFAESVASELKQLEKAIEVRRSGVCDSGLTVKTTLTQFNPGGRLLGGTTMNFSAQVDLLGEDDAVIGEFALSHSAGMNAVATVVGMASPVPVMSPSDDVAGMIEVLAEKTAAVIEKAIEQQAKPAK